MITTGGSGEWGTIASLLKGIDIPRVARVRQKFGSVRSAQSR